MMKQKKYFSRVEVMDKQARMIFFSDIDDTMVGSDKSMSPETKNALEEFIRRGNIFAVSTGRAAAAAVNLVRSLGFYGKCIISAYNGGQIIDTANDKTICRNGIPADLVEEVFETACRFGIHIQTYTDTHVLALEDNEYLRRYSKVQNIPVCVVSDIRNALTQDPCKILAVDYDDPDKVSRFEELVKARYEGILDAFRSSPAYLEIVPTGVNKGAAIRFLSEYLGIPVSNTISAGDEHNDIQMIEAAGIGCAVQNAVPDLKAHADYITENDCNHSAVAEILYKFCL